MRSRGLGEKSPLRISKARLSNSQVGSKSDCQLLMTMSCSRTRLGALESGCPILIIMLQNVSYYSVPFFILGNRG